MRTARLGLGFWRGRISLDLLQGQQEVTECPKQRHEKRVWFSLLKGGRWVRSTQGAGRTVDSLGGGLGPGSGGTTEKEQVCLLGGAD